MAAKKLTRQELEKRKIFSALFERLRQKKRPPKKVQPLFDPVAFHLGAGRCTYLRTSDYYGKGRDRVTELVVDESGYEHVISYEG